MVSPSGIQVYNKEHILQRNVQKESKIEDRVKLVLQFKEIEDSAT
jgi:hypothetical protein